MKKNFILFALYFITLFLVSSCSRELFSDDRDLTVQIFNKEKENFDKLIGIKYDVSWNQETKGYSDYFKADVKSYPISIGTEIGKKDFTSFNLIVVGDRDIFLLKSSPNSSSGNKSPTIFNQHNFSGGLKLFDTNHNLLYDRRYLNGLFLGVKTDLSTKRDAENTNCYTIETTYYTAYYDELSNGSLIYLYTEIDYETRETFCSAPGGPSVPGGIIKNQETNNKIFDDTMPIEAHIDDSGLDENECAKAVYDSLIAKSNLFNNLLNNFKGKSMVNLNFRFENLGKTSTSVLGHTDLNKLYYYGQSTVVLNRDLMGSSQLLIASVFIHEMLHAKFANDLVKAGWDGNKWKDVAKIDKDNLPTLLKDYHEYNFEGDVADHNHIANWYIDHISEALSIFDNNQHTKDFYENLAWTGLSESDAYEDKTAEELTEIYNLYMTNLKTEPCAK